MLYCGTVKPAISKRELATLSAYSAVKLRLLASSAKLRLSQMGQDKEIVV
jgi:hypothetical protein